MVITALAVCASLATCATLLVYLKGETDPDFIIIASVFPAALTPSLTYLTFRLLFRLELAEERL